MSYVDSHIAIEDLQRYICVPDDNPDEIGRIEDIQKHLDECEICRKRLAVCMSMELLLEDDLMGVGLNVLKSEAALRRKLIAAKVLSVGNNEITAGFAKAIANGKAYARSYNSIQLSTGLQPAFRGYGDLQKMPIDAPDGCLVDVKREKTNLIIDIQGNKKGKYLVILAPSQKYKQDDEDILVNVAEYDRINDKSRLMIESVNLPEEFEIYIQPM